MSKHLNIFTSMQCFLQSRKLNWDDKFLFCGDADTEEACPGGAESHSRPPLQTRAGVSAAEAGVPGSHERGRLLHCQQGEPDQHAVCQVNKISGHQCLLF